ncbi:MAG: excinuclease ABC subunit UvrA [Bacteroidia bacterium]|nr:excinuclease ABC subunit UvrA [Bacteroidia bacterium]MCX7764773.1 excinuclease ABC subunit UvrA [Bacteroidia bacterium]MDW8057625.1 excinuclease ABC subunit UvrA [Bacteroidia bacterium]
MSLSEAIRIVGARQNTLKNLTVEIPRHKLTVLCGWSGSGKTTLAFDTLYAEGFGAYVESLSTYVRQFLPRLPRPAVDRIEGLAPAIALQQNRFTAGFNSTVATLSELYPYLRLLFAKVGQIFSPISGAPVERYTIEEVVEFLLQQPAGTEVLILRPLQPEGDYRSALEKLVETGYDRFYQADSVYEWPDYPPSSQEVYVVVDRVFIEPEEVELRARITESIEEVWYAHGRRVWVWIQGKGEFFFSGELYAEGYTFREPTPELFNYFSSYGACPKCQGKGRSLSLKESLVIPDPTKSLATGLVALWEAIPEMEPYRRQFIEAAAERIPPELPYYRYTTQQKRLLWWGDPLKGIVGIFGSYERILHLPLEREKAAKLFSFQGEGPCLVCEGSRLHPDTQWIRVAGLSLPQVMSLSLGEFSQWLESINLPEPRRSIAEPLLQELRHRTRLLLEVGLEYLTLDRAGETLSGGESQRLQLATVLGGQLTGAIYVLDEPTIGLHPRDTHRLLQLIRQLQQMPNTVVVVEHDETFIREADHLVELGPMSGDKGGEVVFAGTFKELMKANTHTARYFQSPRPPLRTVTFSPRHPFIEVEGVCMHNLKNVSVSIPSQALTVITGVSGSGKTTLAIHFLATVLEKYLVHKGYKDSRGREERMVVSQEEIRRWVEGWAKQIVLPKGAFERVEILSQQHLVRNRRSVIATVSGIYDGIRELFAQAAKKEGWDYPARFFSFNVPGGRCEVCEGEGVIVKSMQFLADIRLPCPACGGKRFQPFILEVELGGKNISEILDMTVEEAFEFFSSLPQISQASLEALRTALNPLLTLGLGYLKLGQSTAELSGGEATRLKLLPYLRAHSLKTIFFIDEPTTGLHFDDVKRLVDALRQLLKNGHTIVAVEHNLDFISQADWVIDLGPEGGDKGGEVLYQGPVAKLLEHPTSYTAAALREWYANRTF